jgi:hypothetical protein
MTSRRDCDSRCDCDVILSVPDIVLFLTPATARFLSMAVQFDLLVAGANPSGLHVGGAPRIQLPAIGTLSEWRRSGSWRESLYFTAFSMTCQRSALASRSLFGLILSEYLHWIDARRDRGHEQSH